MVTYKKYTEIEQNDFQACAIMAECHIFLKYNYAFHYIYIYRLSSNNYFSAEKILYVKQLILGHRIVSLKSINCNVNYWRQHQTAVMSRNHTHSDIMQMLQ